jgi:hypothetical protein
MSATTGNFMVCNPLLEKWKSETEGLQLIVGDFATGSRISQ